MIRLRAANRSDFDRLVELFERSNDAPYPVAAVLEEKLDAGYFGPAEATVAIEGDEIVAASVLCGRFLRLIAVDRDHRGSGIGSQLLTRAEQQARALSCDRLVIAAEPGNYFTPGIFAEDRGSVGFFEARGYEATDQAVNLTVQLDRNPALEEFVRADVPTSSEELAEITHWIRVEFGAIWAFEIQRSFKQTPPSIVIRRESGQIRGFSAHCANNAVLGTYGPAGVAREWRRSGYGRSLLLASLSDLRARGFDRAIIQWAASLEFYARSCGATPSERFVIMTKTLN